MDLAQVAVDAQRTYKTVRLSDEGVKKRKLESAHMENGRVLLYFLAHKVSIEHTWLSQTRLSHTQGRTE